MGDSAAVSGGGLRPAVDCFLWKCDKCVCSPYCPRSVDKLRTQLLSYTTTEQCDYKNCKKLKSLTPVLDSMNAALRMSAIEELRFVTYKISCLITYLCPKYLITTFNQCYISVISVSIFDIRIFFLHNIRIRIVSKNPTSVELSFTLDQCNLSHD